MPDFVPWWIALPVAALVLVKVGREQRWLPRLMVWIGVER